ncbi:MAG: molybdopterin biosynthesis protein [Anaerolineales bacterium]|jgi:putative molybdopterin biosynthesis protein
MSVYLHDIPLNEAKALFEAALTDAQLWGILGEENIPLDVDALGRVLAEAILAKVSSPHYHAAAMDGFVVRADQTVGAQPSNPLMLRIGDQARYVDTGDLVPDGFDAVVPIENVESRDENGKISKNIRLPKSIRIRAAVTPWAYIRMMGEDIIVTQLVLPAGHLLRPADLGAIAAAGYQEIQVARRPRVAILPTGSELVPIGSILKPGSILEYNSLVLAAQIRTWGGLATRLPIIPDDFEAICVRIREIAPEYDLILLGAGSSAGAEDFSAKVVEKLGTLLVHGVAVRPGHPVILGLLNIDNRTIPIIGVPGYPVSSAMTGEIFVEPLLAKWSGRRANEMPVEMAEMTRKITSPAGDDDYIRVAVGKVGKRTLAAPLARGAGIITSLVHADGLVILPRGVQGVEAGELVPVLLYSKKAEIERTIFCIGSHDLTMDLLAQFLIKRDRRLTSANVGSQGGLVALQRGEAHLAGSHLLDPETGEYNISYLRKYLAGIPTMLMALVLREQGFMVKRGNPKSIKSLKDINKPGIVFVNRQRGAGTRVLLDYHLGLERIPLESIHGYHQEEYTHLGVAMAISSGRADCGLGIAAAAQALDLDFLPLFQERYDLVIPKEHATSQLLAPLFDVIADKKFRFAVVAMPGYDVSVMGKLILET